MPGQPTKPGNYGGDMVIITKKRGTCGSCRFFCEDGSCILHPVVIKEVGTDFWRTCHDYAPRPDQQLPDRQKGRKRPPDQAPVKPAKKPLPDVPCAHSQTVSVKGICTRRCAPHYGRKCEMCSYYQPTTGNAGDVSMKKAPLQKAPKGQWIDWEDVDWDVSRTARTPKRSKRKKTKQQTAAASPKAASPQRAKSPPLKAVSVTVQQKTARKPAAPAAKPAPLPAKSGCRYLSGTDCKLKGTPCAHGGQHCLFFRPHEK